MKETLNNAPEQNPQEQEQNVTANADTQIEQQVATENVEAVEANEENQPESEVVKVEAEVEEPEVEKALESHDAEEKEEETFPENAPKIPIAAKPKKEKKVLVHNPDDFDWDTVGKDKDIYSKNERDHLEDVYDKTLKSINNHEVLEGKVVSVSPREVIVNIGFKSDGMIPYSEVRYNKSLKIGDIIEVYIESQEDSTGQLMLSHKKARTLRSWERVNQAYNNDEIIEGLVKWRTKGGLVVDVFGIEAFLPGSQIDVKPIRDYDIFVGKTMEFKIVKINHEYKNVVVSHKALIEDEIESQKAAIIAGLEKGQVLEGIVKNITSYGVFIDLGGVDGLIHITDLSWGRINHPEEVVKLDEKIQVVILDFDDNKKRIALGLKQLTPHPWQALDPNLKVGDKVKGRVVVLADYGAFIEIASGVEGLIHVSEMSWSQHLRTAQDFMKVGDEVEAVILTLDREDRKMSLGIKQLIPDPWIDIASRYPVGSKHNAIVRNFTTFGIFVELEEGVDGLTHISDLSWTKKIKHPAEFTKIGEKIDVVVLDVDMDNRRLSLGHKQLEENPWDTYDAVFAVDSIHEGTVAQVADKGYLINLPYGVEGFAPSRHMKKEDGSMAKEGDVLEFKVIEFSKEGKKIIVSHARIWEEQVAATKIKEENEKDAEEKSTQKAVKRLKDNMEKTTLGDLQVLADLKEEMLEGEKAKLEEMVKKAENKTKKAAKETAPKPEVKPEETKSKTASEESEESKE
ncbi:MAG: 30S ribosomal protein S1 [Bacteroidales bacterium]|jgi:small subunit ribosomal protein S1|nr:30S ribosomal protein S1 [Bacteroidales bacterium]